MAKTVMFARGKGKTVNLAELAGIFGVDVNTIRKCMTQGMPHTKLNERRYEFDTAKCLHWRLQVEADKADEEKDRIEYDEAKRRKEVANALTAELELAKARDQVANIDDVMANVCEALDNVRAGLVGLPSRLAGVLEYQEAKEIRKILNDDIKQVLNGLAEYEHRYKENE